MGGLSFFDGEGTEASSVFAREKQRGSRVPEESAQRAPLFGFTGYVADNESGLMYARNRYYSPTLGRFVSRDPWADHSMERAIHFAMAIRAMQAGSSLYAYQMGNPGSGTDAYGYWGWLDVASMIPIIGTLVNALVDPQGIHAADYASHRVTPTRCCNMGTDAAELACNQGIGYAVAGNIAAYGASGFIHDVLDAISAFLPFVPFGLIATLDGAVNTAITLYKISKIIDAGNAAKVTYCNCPGTP